MADVFISYASDDRELAKEVAAILEAHGLTVWWDTNLLGGQSYREAITKEIDAAKAVAVLWTPRSVRSEWVVYEADRGFKTEKLVMLRTPDLDPSEIPPPYPAAAHATSIDDHKMLLESIRALTGGATADGVKRAMRVPRRYRPATKWALAGLAALALIGGAAGAWYWTSARGTSASDPVFDQLADAYKSTSIKHPRLKTVTLAHWAVESGLGRSELARQHYNFSNMPWLEALGPACSKTNFPPGSELAYCRFASLQTFIDAYWRYVEQMPEAKLGSP